MPVIKGLCKNVNHFCTAFFFTLRNALIKSLFAFILKFYVMREIPWRREISGLLITLFMHRPPHSSARNDKGGGKYLTCNEPPFPI